MKSKKIWIINHYAMAPSQGGLSRHFYFSKYLAQKGDTVRIFTSSAIHNTDVNMIKPEEKTLFKEIEVDGQIFTYIKSSQYKGNGFGRIKNMLGFAFSLKKIKKAYGSEKPDVIYTSSPDLFTAYYAEKLAKKMKVPCVVEIRDLWPLSIVEYKNISPKNPIIVALYMLEKKIYKRADAIVFTMPGGKDYIKDKKWEKAVSASKIFNVNNGIDALGQESDLKNYEYHDIDLDDKKSFKVVYTGSIREVNNLSALLDCAKLLKDDNVKFILFGDGSQRAELEKRAADENISNVVFKGYVDKKYIPSVCSKADVNFINVKPTGVSKYGVSWNKLFDYMNAEKPVLSNVKVNYDFIEKYSCGIACEKQDAQTVKDAILQIKNLPEDEYVKMCRNAKQGAKDFDFKSLTEKFDEVLNYAILNRKK